MTSDSLPYSVSLDLALNSGGADPRTYAAMLPEAKDALAEVLEAKQRLEVLTIVSREDDLAEAASVAAELSKNTSEIFVLGMGGSSMGARSLAAIADPRRTPRVTILDNLDGDSFGAILERADLKTARFVAVSKSGSTAETLAQTLTAADAIDRAGGGKYLKQHFAVITEPKQSALKQWATDLGCAVLDHPLGIGGRYSVLSVVGLLPALLMGLDAKAVRAGAAAALTHNPTPAEGAALHYALSAEGRLNETVQWAYADALGPFGFWWRQLWAESLGKDGKGATPVPATGPCDQHSQLQLYLDGPGGALFTVIAPDSAGRGPKVPPDAAKKLGLDYLSGRSIGDVVDAEARATAETLAKRGRPVRTIRIRTVDEKSLGALFMHFMLEVIVMAKLMGVNAFDQPAVEEGKVLARKYLAGSG